MEEKVLSMSPASSTLATPSTNSSLATSLAPERVAFSKPAPPSGTLTPHTRVASRESLTDILAKSATTIGVGVRNKVDKVARALNQSARSILPVRSSRGSSSRLSWDLNSRSSAKAQEWDQNLPLEPSAYKLQREVGRGASATVWAAKCIPVDMAVAIKIIDLEASEVDPSVFFQEARTMHTLCHPRLLRHHVAFVQNRNLWMVMPLIEGGDASRVMEQLGGGKGLPERVVASIMHDVVEGLAYLHAMGCIHRDIKGANIMLDGCGNAYLGDFTVAAAWCKPLIPFGSTAGSLDVNKPAAAAVAVIKGDGTAKAAAGAGKSERYIEGCPPESQVRPSPFTPEGRTPSMLGGFNGRKCLSTLDEEGSRRAMSERQLQLSNDEDGEDEDMYRSSPFADAAAALQGQEGEEDLIEELLDLSDWGICCGGYSPAGLESSTTLEGTLSTGERFRCSFKGTLPWMAPEVVQQSPYNCKADIWSVGMTLLELATGANPLAKLDTVRLAMRIVHGDPPSLPEGGRYSKTLQQAVNACLQKDPARRPTAKQLLNMPFFKRTAWMSKPQVANMVARTLMPRPTANNGTASAGNAGGSSPLRPCNANGNNNSGNGAGGGGGGTGPCAWLDTVAEGGNISHQYWASGSGGVSRGLAGCGSGGAMQQRGVPSVSSWNFELVRASMTPAQAELFSAAELAQQQLLARCTSFSAAPEGGGLQAHCPSSAATGEAGLLGKAPGVPTPGGGGKGEGCALEGSSRSSSGAWSSGATIEGCQSLASNPSCSLGLVSAPSVERGPVPNAREQVWAHVQAATLAAADLTAHTSWANHEMDADSRIAAEQLVQLMLMRRERNHRLGVSWNRHMYSPTGCLLAGQMGDMISSAFAHPEAMQQQLLAFYQMRAPSALPSSHWDWWGEEDSDGGNGNGGDGGGGGGSGGGGGGFGQADGIVWEEQQVGVGDGAPCRRLAVGGVVRARLTSGMCSPGLAARFDHLSARGH